MKLDELEKKLEGIQTAKTVMETLNVDKAMAIYYVHRLRKAGYVKTMHGKGRMRVYRISPQNRVGGTSYYDIINKKSPIKVIPLKTHAIHGRTPTTEEALVYAVTTKSLRTILAAMSLFRRVNDWKELYRLAKSKNIEREVGALHELAKKTIGKVRHMPKRFMKNALPKRGENFKDIIDGLRSKEYEQIENNWKVHLPFSKKDLEEYA
ncbi:hypothetical protein JW898_02765 [Candidatus Woesearchaeota archaeon]|nr:hypothetical protein [Candidatus Woesearchaeota archaeon]